MHILVTGSRTGNDESYEKHLTPDYAMGKIGERTKSRLLLKTYRSSRHDGTGISAVRMCG